MAKSLLISKRAALIQLAPQPAAPAVTPLLSTTQLHWGPANGAQAAGQQGFTLFSTLTRRKQEQKANIALYLKYVFVDHSFFTAFICNTLGILCDFF